MVETWRIQAFSIFASISFIWFIVQMMKRRRLREEYSLLWLASGCVILILSLWRGSLEVLAGFLGVAYAPAALFIVLIGAILLILLHFSLVISSHKEKIRSLIQEMALLKWELDEKWESHLKVLSREEDH